MVLCVALVLALVSYIGALVLATIRYEGQLDIGNRWQRLLLAYGVGFVLLLVLPLVC